MGVHMGYEPDGPREEMVYPGQEVTVTLKILIVRRRPRAAVEQFDKGLELYNKGTPENYSKAVESFQAALQADPNYSQAALYLGRVYRDLFQDQDAEKWMRRAIEIDPDYLEARATLGGMLLDKGALDESIRQLNAVVERDPKYALAWYLLAQALRMKELYPDSIEAARKAIALTPTNAEANFWLAESLRLSGKYRDASDAYQQYLKLSDFDSKLAGKMNYYVLGYLGGIRPQETRGAARCLAGPPQPGVFRAMRQPAAAEQFRRRHRLLPEGADLRPIGPLRAFRAGAKLHQQGAGLGRGGAAGAGAQALFRYHHASTPTWRNPSAPRNTSLRSTRCCNR